MSPDTREEIEHWYKELYKLMWAMVWDVANIERFYLQPDDVFADLSEELCKVVLHYAGKPTDEMKAILITSLRNRCKDLQVMEYYTYRDDGADAVSLDTDLDRDCDGPTGIGVWKFEGASLVERLGRPSVEDMHFDLEGFLETLEDDEFLLVMEVLEPSERCYEQIDLAIMRKSSTIMNGNWRFRPTQSLYARALGWTRQRLLTAWEGVQRAFNAWTTV